MRPVISMITLGVSDLARSVAFYRALGFPQMESSDSVAFFTLQGAWLSLFPREALARDAGMQAGEAPGFSGVTVSHNVPTQDAVRVAFAEAIAAGAREVKRPAQAEWGGFHGYFADPDGHLWEVAHNPFAWVGPPLDEA